MGHIVSNTKEFASTVGLSRNSSLNSSFKHLSLSIVLIFTVIDNFQTQIMNSILIIALIACSLDLSQSQYNFQYENSVYSNNEIDTGSSNWLGFSNNNWFQYGSTNRRSEAKIEACGSRSCKVRECSSSRFDSGWNIRGSDYVAAEIMKDAVLLPAMPVTP